MAAWTMVSGGTDTHLCAGRPAAEGRDRHHRRASLERAGITCNKNGVPFDPEKPTVTSGIRVGSPAATTRGFGLGEFDEVGSMMVEVLDGLAANPDDNAAVETAVRARVEALCRRFPIYG